MYSEASEHLCRLKAEKQLNDWQKKMIADFLEQLRYERNIFCEDLNQLQIKQDQQSAGLNNGGKYQKTIMDYLEQSARLNYGGKYR